MTNSTVREGKLKVVVMESTPNAMRVIAAAAGQAYRKKPAYALKDTLSEGAVERIIKHCLYSKHYSVLEHAKVSISVEGLSRSAQLQLVRHRLFSFTASSQHYTDNTGFEYHIPVESKRRKDQVALDKYIKAMEMANEVYADLVHNHGWKVEEARQILPNGVLTNIVVTGNLRNWLEFIEKRTCDVNTTEIFELATKIQIALRKLFPIVFEQAGPPCLTQGKCFEGLSKFCGRPRIKPGEVCEIIDRMDPEAPTKYYQQGTGFVKPTVTYEKVED